MPMLFANGIKRSVSILLTLFLLSSFLFVTPASAIVDNTVLTTKITAAQAKSNTTLSGNIYTSASFTTLQTALTAALTVKNDGSATQVQIDTAVGNLQAAMDGLVAPMPKTGWIASASNAHASTPAQRALDNGATSGTPGESAYWTTGALQTSGMWYKVDMGSLQTFDMIQLIIYKTAVPVSMDIYVSNDNTNWGTAIASKAGTPGTMEITVNPQTARYIKIVQTGTSATQWWSMYEFSVYKSVDKSALNGKIAATQALTSSSYTTASWASLQTALTAAVSVSGNGNATQAQIDTAAGNLQSAIDGLVVAVAVAVDKTALNANIATAQALNSNSYTTASWSSLQTALTAAVNVSNDANAAQAQVDAAAAALQTAISALQVTGVPAVTLENYYVSTSGSDLTGDGSIENPFASIEKAKNAVKTNLVAGLTKDVHVYVRGGTYYLDNAIKLNETDSGNNGFKVIYTSYNNENVRIIGGKPVTGWTDTGNGIYSADITGRNNFWALFDNGVRLPNASETSWQSITVADKSHLQAKYGNATSWFGEVLKVNTLSGSSVTTDISKGAFSGNLEYLQGAKEYINSAGEWAISGNSLYYKPLDGSNLTGHEIIAPTTDRIFYLQGTEGNRVKNIVIQGMNLEMNDFGPNLIAHAGHNGDQTTEYPDNLKGLVDLDYTESIVVRDSKLTDAGYMGVVINHYGQNNTIYGNYIEDTGYAGIFLIGENPGSLKYFNKNNVISNNEIKNVGKFVGHGSGIYLMNSGDNQITHNNISNVPRYGISMKGIRYGVFAANGITGVPFEDHYQYNQTTRNYIGYNTIYNTGMRSGDGGGVEGWGIGRDNRIDHNIIYNAYRGVATTGWRGHSIFTDDATHHTMVTNNIVYDENAVAVNAGTMMKSISNYVSNNVFDIGYEYNGAVNVGPYIEPSGGMVFEKNIVYTDAPGTLNANGTWSNTGNGDRVMLKFDDGSYNVSGTKALESMASMNKNVYFNKLGIPSFQILGQFLSLDQWKSASNNTGKYDKDSILADPNFKNTANRDYRLNANSPAFAQGIRSIESSQIGLLPDYKFASNDNVKTLFITAANNTQAATALPVGRTVQLAVSARTEKNYALDNLTGVTFSSNNPGAVTVSTTGLATAIGNGTAIITANYVGKTDSYTVYAGDTPNAIDADNIALKITKNEATLVNPMIKTAGGNSLGDVGYVFSAVDPSIATVDASGRVEAKKNGSTAIVITANVSGETLTKQITVKVTDPSVVSIEEMQGVTVTNSFGAVLTKWNPIANTKVNVYRKGETDQDYVKIAQNIAGNGYIDSSVEVSKSYSYRMSAVNTAGEGPLSDPISVTILAEEILFSDTFDTSISNLWKDLNGAAVPAANAGITNGQWVPTGTWSGGNWKEYYVELGNTQWKDYAVEADITFNGLQAGAEAYSGFGMITRAKKSGSTNNFYQFIIRGNNTQYEYYRKDSAWVMLSSLNNAAKPVAGTTFKMRVENVGNIQRAYLNGVMISETTDSVFTSGGIGIGFGKELISVDNVRVVKLKDYAVTINQAANGTITSNAVNGKVTVGGNVEFTFTPANGYKVKNATVNGNVVGLTNNSYSVTNVQGDLTITAEFEPISKTVMSITTPAAITQVANGTAKTAAALGLPSNVGLMTDLGSVSANVTWDVGASNYDPSNRNEQTFTVNGTVALPAGVANPNSLPLTTSISVTVTAGIGVQLTGPVSVLTGQPIILTYSLVNVTTSVYAQDLTISYDPTQLQFVSAESIVNGFSVVGESDANGTVRLLAAASGSTGVVTGTIDVLKLNFQARQLNQTVSSAVYVTQSVVADVYGVLTPLNSLSVYHVQLTASTVVDKTALNAQIATAQSTVDAALVSPTRWGYYSQSAVNALNAAISSARSVVNDVNATQALANQAVIDLNTALVTFAGAVNTTASIGDLAVLASHYGATSSHLDWSTLHMYDFNQDNKLDIIDLAALARKILGQ